MRKQSEKRAGSRSIAAILALLSFTSYMPVSCSAAFGVVMNDNTLPDLAGAIGGKVELDKNNSHIQNVIVNDGQGRVAQFDWNSFNVGKNGTVKWIFNSTHQTALNRVLASGGTSMIYGKLLSASGKSSCPSCASTSKVILINPAGIMFGAGSQVNLNSFTASTYDIKGIKNVKEGKLDSSYYSDTNPQAGTLFNLVGFGKTVQYVKNNVGVDGNGMIEYPSNNLAKITANGSTIIGDKNIAFVGNKVEIKNSTVKTHFNETPNSTNGKQTRSGVRIVTGDGVNFHYSNEGDIYNADIKLAGSGYTDGKDYGIDINNSTIHSGYVYMNNGASGSNSGIKISNKSEIIAKKLRGTTYNGYDETATGTAGSVDILSKGTTTITDSVVQTNNETGDTTTYINKGNITIAGNNGVTIKNSNIATDDTYHNTYTSTPGGNIKITSSNGNIHIEKTSSATGTNNAIVAAGNLSINAKGSVNIKNYDRVQAKGQGTANNANADQRRKLDINASSVNLTGTVVSANDVNINTTSGTGTINIAGTKVLGNNTKLYGKNTTIDNSLMEYNNLDLYDKSNSTLLNNITIKNDTTFNDKDSTTGLALTANGNLTLDKATLKKQTNGSTTKTNQKSISLVSTNGNITVQNGSNITTSAGNLTAQTPSGSITVKDGSTLYANGGSNNLTATKNINVTGSGSKVWAKNGNVKLWSTGNKVTVKDGGYVASEGGNTTIQQALSMNLGTDFAGGTVGASNSLTLKSSGDIIGSRLEKGTSSLGTYTGLNSLNDNVNNAKFIYRSADINANKNISISDLRSAKDTSFVANTGSVNLASTVGMNLDSVSVNSGTTTTVNAADSVLLNYLTINGGNKTTVSGKTVETVGNSFITTNGNKLALNAERQVNIAVQGVTNANNGLEINADVNTSGGSAPLAGKTVKVKAVDGTLAISKIKADTLDLTANNILAGKTTISSSKDNVKGLVDAGVSMDSKGYIEIKTDGGFNLDKSTDYNSGNSGMYTGGNYGSTSNTHTDKVGGQYDVAMKDKVEILNTWTEKVGDAVETKTDKELGRTETEGSRVLVDSKTEVIDVQNPYYSEEDKAWGTLTTTQTTNTYEIAEDVTYETNIVQNMQEKQTTQTTTGTITYQDYQTTTDTRDSQHIATLNNNEKNGFVLVYGKTSSTSGPREQVEVNRNVVTGPEVTSVVRNFTETSKGTYVERNVRGEGDSAKKIQVKLDPVNEFCPDIIPDAPNNGEAIVSDYDIASRVKLTRKSEGTSDAAPLQLNILDAKSAQVNAAASLVIPEDEGNYANNEEDNEDALQ